MEGAPAARAEGGGDDAAVDELAQGVQQMGVQERRFVYFSLGTTDLDRDCSITRIVACRGEDEVFSVSVSVPHITINGALEQFIDFLGQEPAVLLGHNIWLFDCPRLANALQANELVERFQRTNHRFVNTLPIFMDINKDVENYKLPTLYIYYTGKDLADRGAPNHARALKEIVDEAELTEKRLRKDTFNLQDVMERAENLRLVRMHVISQFIADKATKIGFSFLDLRTVFVNNGVDAARQMLNRLTTREVIINRIFNGLQENAGNNE